MAIKITTPSRELIKGFNLKPYMVVIGILLLALTIYVAFRMESSGRRLISISVLSIIAGVIFEGKRLSDKWSAVFWTALKSFILSFVAFLPLEDEHDYSFEDHIRMWPYLFILIFAIYSIVCHGNKVIPKLTEGVTLLQSIAAVYWVVDFGLIDTNSLFLKPLMLVVLVFSLYTVFHAFTHAILSRNSRLILSIWSSIIMMLFASDNIYRVYQNEQIENTADITHGLYIGLQFFLLGVSCIYIVQNFIMVMGFLPGKGRYFNTQYYREVKELKIKHIIRYSDKQVSILHSFFCVLFTGGIFVLNYHYQILPRHVAIWIVFIIFPFVLSISNFATQRIPQLTAHFK